MKCYQCGENLPPDSVFCGKCGVRLGFDQALINAAKIGEEGAVTQLYNATYNSVYQAIRPLIKDEDTALDILQDTYIKAFESLNQLENPQHFRAWVKRIATNKSKDWLKRKKPTLFSEMQPDEDGGEVDFMEEREFAQPDVLLDKDETRRLLWEIIDSLSDDQRLAVSMYYFQEMQVKAIAEELEISENTVKSRLNYARKSIEAKVLHLEKQGTKIYSLAPIPLLLWLYRSAEAQAAYAPSQAVLAGIQQSVASATTAGVASSTGATGAGTTGAGTTGAGASGAGGAASGSTGAVATGATASTTTAGIGIAAKIAAVVIAATIGIGGGVAGITVIEHQNQQALAAAATTDINDDNTDKEEDSSKTEEEALAEKERINAERIEAYVAKVEEIGSGDFGSNRFLLYDCDGDGLYELMMTLDDGYEVHARLLSIDALGNVTTMISISDLNGRGRGFMMFETLRYQEREYLVLSYCNSTSAAAEAASYFYGYYQFLDINEDKLEAVHVIDWRYTYDWVTQTSVYTTLTVDGAPMDEEELESILESAEIILELHNQDYMDYDEFIRTYKTANDSLNEVSAADDLYVGIYQNSVGDTMEIKKSADGTLQWPHLNSNEVVDLNNMQEDGGILACKLENEMYATCMYLYPVGVELSAYNHSISTFSKTDSSRIRLFMTYSDAPDIRTNVYYKME